MLVLIVTRREVGERSHRHVDSVLRLVEASVIDLRCCAACQYDTLRWTKDRKGDLVMIGSGNFGKVMLPTSETDDFSGCVTSTVQ